MGDEGDGGAAGGDEMVEEEFSVWKKNTPFLCDLVISHALEWPSLTVQWLPLPPPLHDGPLAVHKLVLGTHTSDDFPDFLMLANVHLPRDPASALHPDPDEVIPKVFHLTFFHSTCLINSPNEDALYNSDKARD